MPNSKSFKTLLFENLLPILKEKSNVHLIWVVYQPDKFKNMSQNDLNVSILDIHDFKNAIDILKTEKPDIIFADSTFDLLSYAFSSAGKFLDIPIVSGFLNEPLQITNVLKLNISYLKRFFNRSVPTDTKDSKKVFMKRGKFFIYKYLFLFKTLLATDIGLYRALNNCILILKLILTDTSGLKNMGSIFANTLHWLESEPLVEKLVNEGYNISSLVVTGNPMYDEAFRRSKTWKSKSKSKDNKIRVLFLPDALWEHGYWTKQQQDNMIKKIVLKFLEHKNEFSLTIKIHPTSALISNYTSIIHSIDSTIPVFQQGDIMDFLHDADVVISFTTFSTTSMYALILKKPIIICNEINYDDRFINNNIATLCSDPSNILDVVYKVVLLNTTNEKFVKELFYKTDGCASQRLSNAIFSLMKNNPKSADS